MEEEHLARFRRYAELFSSYFPVERKEQDLVVLRGHQLIESLVFRFLRDHVNNPEELEDFRPRWESVLALVKALRQWNEVEHAWIWSACVSLERARNKVTHYLEPPRWEATITSFVNVVRSNYSSFSSIPGDDDLKKAIFILFFSLSSLLALEEFPPCTATSLVRADIAKVCQETIVNGFSSDGAA